jgi:hypothetical protein
MTVTCADGRRGYRWQNEQSEAGIRRERERERAGGVRRHTIRNDWWQVKSKHNTARKRKRKRKAGNSGNGGAGRERRRRSGGGGGGQRGRPAFL